MTWEYYFRFDGGVPRWTSAMSQATGLEALTRAYRATKNPYYLQVASGAMPIFSVAPPVGVNVATPPGIRFLQYSFTPKTSIISAFLQTPIGLRDYATVSGNPRAAQLFAAGNAEALSELPSFDTGAWSLHQPGLEDTVSYHELVTGFLAGLCRLTATPLYCTTAAHFQAYLRRPPALTQLTFKGSVTQIDHAAVRALQVLARRHRGGPGLDNEVLDQRRLPVRDAELLDPRPQAGGDLLGRAHPDGSGRQLQADYWHTRGLRSRGAPRPLDSPRHAAAHHSLHGQRRRRQDLRRRLHRSRLRRGRTQDAGDLHRSRPQPVGVAVLRARF